MLDGEVPEKLERVWAFAVPTRSGGRRQWPEALRAMAVERIAAGAGVRKIAEEIGANKFLVTVWVKNAQTGDLDIAQFHSISLAVDDAIEQDLLTTLQTADERFRAIPSPMDGRRTLRYAIRVGSQEEFAVDLLCPLRGPERGSITELKAMKGDAQLLRYLDFLIYGEINAVALYGLGVPINVPAPERYAVHKLIVFRMRIETAESQAKARKDIRQAEALLEVLLEDRPYELEAVWTEAMERGPSWRSKLLEGVAMLKKPVIKAMQGRMKLQLS